MHNYIRPFLFGFLRIRLEGNSPERFLNMCVFHHLNIWGLRPAKDGNAYELYLMLSGYDKLKMITEKTNTYARVLGRYGLPCYIRRYKGRTWLLLGLFFCMILPFILNQFLWSISISGNEYRTQDAITECLEKQGIKRGRKVSSIDCNQVVRTLRQTYEDIIWSNAYIVGSTLYIRIKENPSPNIDGMNQDNSADNSNGNTGSNQGYDLIADTDGRVTSIITRGGTPLVHPGDKVKKNQILVQGRVDTIGDDQTVQDCHYVKADADVYLESSMTYSYKVPTRKSKKEYTEIEKEQYVMRIGPLRISLGSIKKTFKPYTLTRQLYELTPQTSEFPISMEVKRLGHYEETYYNCSKKYRKMKLNQHFRRFCEELEKKGVVITENNVKIQVYADYSLAEGSLTVNKKADSYQSTKILSLEVPLDEKSIEEGE